MTKKRKPKYKFYAYENKNKEIVVNTNLLAEKIDYYPLAIVEENLPHFLRVDPRLLDKHLKIYTDTEGFKWAELSYALYDRIFYWYINSSDCMLTKNNFFDIVDDFYEAQKYIFETQGYVALIRRRLN